MQLKLIPIHDQLEEYMAPVYSSEEAACFDIKADIKGRSIKIANENNIIETTLPDSDLDRFILEPYHRALIPTGFIFVIPHGYSMRLHPRSGHSWKHSIALMNGEGIIDSDYSLETFALLVNRSRDEFIINHGDRIAQGEIVPNNRTTFEVLEVGTPFNNTTNRRGGFGSTGS